MQPAHRPLTRREVLAFTAAAAAFTRCAATPASAPDTASMPPAERAVRATLDAHLVASNEADVDRILSHLAEDARIDSIVAGDKVSKAEYATAMRGWLAKPENREYRSELRVVRVAFPETTRALVDVETTIRRPASLSRPAWSTDRRIEYALAERNGRWLIVESTYRKK
jgi:ketosteroid isomerase-like protein